MLRSEEAREHLAQAPRHFDDMFGSEANPPSPTESDKAPRKNGDF
jgi:hypothetical protein